MSEEQDNQMEQWLEEYARRRRDELDEPIEMHEATRTMLQGEVSRVYPKSVVTQPQPRDSSAWMAWAIGGATVGVAAIVITYVSNLPQDRNPVVMAEANEAQRTAAEERGRARESKKASADSVSKSAETGKTKTATLGATVDEQNSPTRRIASTAAPAGNKDNPNASGIVEGSPGGAPIETTRAATSNHTAPKQPVAGGFAPDPVNALKRDRAFYNNIRELRQDFTQSNLAVADRKNVLPKAVLMNFRVQRTGNLVDVVDQDGSEYTGIVINEEQYGSETKEKAVQARRLPAANAGADALGAPVVAIRSTAAQRGRASREQFYFRVQGFNLTLGKEVILEATFGSPPEKPIEAGKLTASKLKAEDRAEEDKQAKVNEVKKELSDQKGKAIHATAPMRVMGNAWIEKANYPVDAYQQQLFLPAKAMLKAEPLKKK